MPDGTARTTTGEVTPVTHWFTADEPNPGCDCGYDDALTRLAGGELVCAAEAAARGLLAPTAPTATTGSHRAAISRVP